MKQANREAAKRVGYRYIYQRLIERGTFNGYLSTPYESVRGVPFSEALTEISLDNAKMQ